MRAALLLVALVLCLASPARAAERPGCAERHPPAGAGLCPRRRGRRLFPCGTGDPGDFLTCGNLHAGSGCSRATRRSTATRVLRFGEARVADGRVAQRVHIVDEKGEAWEALYTLEQQPDGTLKITGCSLLKAGQSA